LANSIPIHGELSLANINARPFLPRNELANLSIRSPTLALFCQRSTILSLLLLLLSLALLLPDDTCSKDGLDKIVKCRV
jgi:hypothetical protein